MRVIRKFSNLSERKDALIGKSKPMLALRNSILKIKDLDRPLLVLGENGVGKNLYASIVHKEGKRGLLPFVSVLSTELDIKTGEAKLAKALEEAKNGTLVIQDIELLNPALQVFFLSLLLRNPMPRIIVTAVEHIERLTHDPNVQNCFNKDLYNLLSVTSVILTPLRKRKEDIPELIHYFTKLECKAQGLLQKYYSPMAMETFCDYDWPGNVKELKKAVKRLVLYNPKNHVISEIHHSAIPIFEKPKMQFVMDNSHDIPYINDSNLVLKDRLALIERTIILAQIKKLKGNKSKAAKVMGISREALRKKLLLGQDIIDALDNYKQRDEKL